MIDLEWPSASGSVVPLGTVPSVPRAERVEVSRRSWEAGTPAKGQKTGSSASNTRMRNPSFRTFAWHSSRCSSIVRHVSMPRTSGCSPKSQARKVSMRARPPEAPEYMTESKNLALLSQNSAAAGDSSGRSLGT